MALTLAGIVLALIGAAHSVLGEAAIIRPLARDRRWATRIGPVASVRVARFAWHLTTLAWWALAVVAWGASISAALAWVGLTAAAIILGMLPGHLAWPAFLASGLLALASAVGWSLGAGSAWAITAVGLLAMVGLGIASRRVGLVTWSELRRARVPAPPLDGGVE